MIKKLDIFLLSLQNMSYILTHVFIHIDFIIKLARRLRASENKNEPKGETEDLDSPLFFLAPSHIIFDTHSYKWRRTGLISIQAKASVKVEFRDEKQNCVEVSVKECQIESGCAASFVFTLMENWQNEAPAGSLTPICNYEILINGCPYLLPISIQNWMNKLWFENRKSFSIATLEN